MYAVKYVETIYRIWHQPSSLGFVSIP